MGYPTDKELDWRSGEHVTQRRPALDFDTLREANVERCEQVFHKLDDWTPTDWACAMAGEAGEACNAVKKIRRHEDDVKRGMSVPGGQLVLHDDVAKELADTVIYCDLLAARLGINLGAAIKDKFNEVSAKRNSPIRL